jgi:hypothetical protein
MVAGYRVLIRERGRGAHASIAKRDQHQSV